MLRTVIRKVLLAVLFGLVILAIGYGVAAFISNRYGYKLTDAMFIEGLAILIIGFMMSMKGNPSGASLQGLGLHSAPQISNMNAEATRTERDLTDYYQNFKKHSVVEFAFSNLTVIAGGILIILFSIFFAN